ncbi:hypothetical protein Lesp02_08550 [Lentzea sp. NBRC 105346]|nr:hypothetical protein Lesp02_08550 [Lentzea sp. NBRC 105346]
MALALVLVGTTPAQACPAVIKGNGSKLHPEGVAYDRAHGRFVVGSVVHGTVSTVERDGQAKTLVDDPALITTMGLAVRAGRLYVINGDVGISKKSSPATLKKTAGLGIYNAWTGKKIAYYDLGALDPSREHFGNDVAVAPDGTAYVTDSYSGAIYKVKNKAEVFFRDDRLLPAGRGNGANGIVRLPNGDLLIAHSSGRALYKLSNNVLTQVTTDAPIGAPDGLLIDNGQLLAIDNTAANRVISLKSTDNWTTAKVTKSVPWTDKAPTTMAKSPCGVYVLSGRLDQLNPGTDEFWLRRW